MKTTKLKLLLDGDAIAYRVAFSCEQPIKWDEDTWTVHASENEMMMQIDSYIEKAQKETGIKDYQIFVSSRSNFRKDIDPDYKANRNDKRKPIGLSYCLYYLELLGSISDDSLEADDLIGINSSDTNTVIYAIDKDFLTVPCFRWDEKEGKIVHNTIEQANYNLMLQTLCGDASDNYKGCQGIGPVKARKWLDDNGATWQSVLALYEKQGMTEEDCTRNARLARILRTKDELLTWRPEYV